jgi:hypothetical protein
VLWAYPHLHEGAASPWRSADAAEIDRLTAILIDETDPQEKARVEMKLIETEQERGWQIAREHAAGIFIQSPFAARRSAAAQRDLWLTVGVDDTHRPGYRRLFTATTYHLMLPDQPFVSDLPQWL